ncbi:MAG: ATP-dependent Clp protease ATP-binding subunit, partial [Tannerellaceae bacterium]|nr:ATP-dependent Clp protease ATP-binding subunit [Tannerellaceae bacterium]
MKNNYSKKLIDVITYSREEAARLQNGYIGPEHLMLGIIRDGESKAIEILHELNTDIYDVKKRIEQDIRTSFEVEEIPESNIVISKTSERVLRMSMLEARMFKSEQTNTEHLLLAILKEEFNIAAKILDKAGITYRAVYKSLVNSTGIDDLDDLEEVDEISDRFTDDDDEEEDEAFSSRKESSRSSGSSQPKSPDDTPVLDNFGTDMTRAASENRLDPIVGREKEIERLAQILSRRKKNNPVLIGEPGVGKSAIVEGLALRIIQRKIPRIL